MAGVVVDMDGHEVAPDRSSVALLAATLRQGRLIELHTGLGLVRATAIAATATAAPTAAATASALALASVALCLVALSLVVLASALTTTRLAATLLAAALLPTLAALLTTALTGRDWRRPGVTDLGLAAA
ncbi:MAG: hypothetical protein AAF567_05120 [Actinomycetota bacterium]